GTHQGIYSVVKSELNAVADLVDRLELVESSKLPAVDRKASNAINHQLTSNYQPSTINYQLYGRHDGMASVECSDSYQPACWRAADGRLWFSTVSGGVTWVDPNEAIARSPPPPVLIEEIHMDG